MINGLLPRGMDGMMSRNAILTLLLLFSFMVPVVSAVSSEALMGALPTVADVTPGLDMKNPPGITSQSNEPQYFYVVLGGMGIFGLPVQRRVDRLTRTPVIGFNARSGRSQLILLLQHRP